MVLKGQRVSHAMEWRKVTALNNKMSKTLMQGEQWYRQNGETDGQIPCTVAHLVRSREQFIVERDWVITRIIIQLTECVWLQCVYATWKIEITLLNSQSTLFKIILCSTWWMVLQNAKVKHRLDTIRCSEQELFSLFEVSFGHRRSWTSEWERTVAVSNWLMPMTTELKHRPKERALLAHGPERPDFYLITR